MAPGTKHGRYLVAYATLNDYLTVILVSKCAIVLLEHVSEHPVCCELITRIIAT